jgi:hypothetical protein
MENKSKSKYKRQHCFWGMDDSGVEMWCLRAALLVAEGSSRRGLGLWAAQVVSDTAEDGAEP